MAQKVYPRDHPEPKFLDQSNHPLVAVAETPFLTIGPKSRFPLGFAPLAWPYLAGTAGERRKTLNAARDNFLFARYPPAIGGKACKGVPPAMIVRQTERPCAN
jgi:hypothetical protein